MAQRTSFGCSIARYPDPTHQAAAADPASPGRWLRPLEGERRRRSGGGPFHTGMGLAQEDMSVKAIRPGICRNPKETPMHWSQPAFEDMRFGFEITMYISNR